MASENNPSLTPTKSLSNFRFWCQKVLPLVYDDSLSYYEVLGKMVVQLNDVIDDVNADTENVLTLKDAFLELQTYVNEFFDDIDQLASYAERAEDAQTAANASAINAAASASNASASSLAAMNARDAAVTAKEAAETSASTASTAATNANTKASEAAQSAITAQTAQASASQSATLAATDRSAAQTAANTATSKASEASTSAENAAQSASNAEDAAESVESSSQQIITNTNDIANLKDNPLNYIFPTIYCPINKLLVGETEYAKVNKNIITMKANNVARFYLTGDTIVIDQTLQNIKKLELSQGSYAAEFAILDLPEEGYLNAYGLDCGLIDENNNFYRLALANASYYQKTTWLRSQPETCPAGKYGLGFLWTAAFTERFGLCTVAIRLVKIDQAANALTAMVLENN